MTRKVSILITLSSYFFYVNLAEAVVIERPEKVTIIKLREKDLPNSRIEDSYEWHAGCQIKTPSFSLPSSYAAELEVIWDVSMSWEKAVASPEEIAEHFLASLELNYDDHLGTLHFNAKTIRPQMLGRIRPIATTAGGLSLLRGGSPEEHVTIVHGPIVVPAGATKISSELCNIAPETTVQVYEIQIRMRPLN